MTYPTKVGPAGINQLLSEFQTTTKTLEELAAPHNITRQRAQQLIKKHFKVRARHKDRVNLRSVEHQWEMKRGTYEEYVASVWHEAAARGYDVRGWIHDGRLRKACLFINKHLTYVMLVTNAHQTVANSRYYTHFQMRKPNVGFPAMQVLVVDNPFDSSRRFYIFPREIAKQMSKTRGGFFIPLTEPKRLAGGRPPKLNWEDYCDAWHFFGREEEQE